MTALQSETRPRPVVSRGEFVAMIAMLMATVAFSVDAMLPALPQIAEDVAGGDVTDAALVVATFMAGMGLGTLFAGPLSDAYGRHPVALGGAAIYIPAALAGALAQSIEFLLVARFIQGLGASGPRIVALAIVRDLFSGRQMAQTISFIMTVFAIVPVLAPSLGALLAWAFSWRGIFVAFALFSIISITWLRLRQPETLLPEKRRPFRMRMLAAGLVEILRTPMVARAILAQSMVYSVLFIALMTSQPVIDEVFGRAATFPFWFGVVALISAGASFLNAAVVVRVGMPRVVRTSLAATAGYALFFLIYMTAIDGSGDVTFFLFLILLCAGFSLAGLCIGNLNAIAMQPLGHIAGLAASTISALSTSLGALLAAPATVFFDGTALPAAIGLLISTIVALIVAQGLAETEDVPI